MTKEDMDNLRHMLGAQPHIPKQQWGFRNFFLPGGIDVQSMERLEAAGLVSKGRVYLDTYYYHATEAGCAAIRLNKRQTRDALGG
jgi:hypothetical protein